MKNYFDKRRASIRGYLSRRKEEAVLLSEVVTWVQKRYSISADEVRRSVEEILSSQRFETETTKGPVNLKSKRRAADQGKEADLIPSAPTHQDLERRL